MKYIHTVIIGLVVLVGILLSYFVATKWVKNQAVDSCLTAARIEKTDRNQKVITPENYWYTFCMDKKGY